MSDLLVVLSQLLLQDVQSFPQVYELDEQCTQVPFSAVGVEYLFDCLSLCMWTADASLTPAYFSVLRVATGSADYIGADVWTIAHQAPVGTELCSTVQLAVGYRTLDFTGLDAVFSGLCCTPRMVVGVLVPVAVTSQMVVTLLSNRP